MIQKILYEILGADTTDSSEAEALAEVQNDFLDELNFPAITNLDGLEYKYLSLKTLLGDPSADWAKNKIFYEEYQRLSDNWLSKDASLPKIGIGLADALRRTPEQSGREEQTMVKIDIRTAQSASSALVRNIYLRVRRILEPQQLENYRTRFCSIPFNYSMSRFNLLYQYTQPLLANQITIFYQCKIAFI